MHEIIPPLDSPPITILSLGMLCIDTISSKISISTFLLSVPQFIDGIIVATGPGNFTSLRVGISFGVGLSKSLSIPIYGVSSLQSLVFSFREEIKKMRISL